MGKSKLTTTAEIFTIFNTFFVISVSIFGLLIYTQVNVTEESLNEIQEIIHETLSSTQEELEIARPHYNLVVGFFDPDAKSNQQIKDEISLTLGKTEQLDIRIWNITIPVMPEEKPKSGEATRRADDVSCIIEFPSCFNVSLPYTIYSGVYPQRVYQYGGGYLVGIDYGEDYALHPDTNFVFRVNVTPYKKGDFQIKVTADANNPNTPEPSFQGELTIHVD